MNAIEVTDKLEVIGVLVGAFLILVALGTVVGTPWVYNNAPLASVIQLVGVVAMAAIGVGLVWLSYEQE